MSELEVEASLLFGVVFEVRHFKNILNLDRTHYNYLLSLMLSSLLRLCSIGRDCNRWILRLTSIDSLQRSVNRYYVRVVRLGSSLLIIIVSDCFKNDGR